MKETKKEFEKCWDCGGDGYHENYHNGNHDRCYVCDGTGKLPLGTKKWEDARTDFETKIREEEKRKAYQITAKKVKQWEKKNPKPTGIVTIIYK